MAWPPPPDFPNAGPLVRAMFGILGVVFLGIIALFLWDAVAHPDRWRDARLYVGVGFFGVLVWGCWFFVGGRINQVKFPEKTGAGSAFARVALNFFFFALLAILGYSQWSQFREAATVKEWVWLCLTACFVAAVVTDRIRRRRVDRR
jgi:drug/metabolite transporter (DMT)-like permease